MLHTPSLAFFFEAGNLAFFLEVDCVCVGLSSDVTGIRSGAADSVCTLGGGTCRSVVFVFSLAVAEFICALELSAITCSALGEDCGSYSCLGVCLLRSFHLEMYSSSMHCAPWSGMCFRRSGSKRAT